MRRSDVAGPRLRGLPSALAIGEDAAMDKQSEKLDMARRQLDLLTAVGAALLVAVLIYAVYTAA